MFIEEWGINYVEGVGLIGGSRNTLLWLGLMQDDKILNDSAKGYRVLWHDPVGSASQRTNHEAGARYVWSGR